jgi:hypothetical protein
MGERTETMDFRRILGPDYSKERIEDEIKYDKN